MRKSILTAAVSTGALAVMLIAAPAHAQSGTSAVSDESDAQSSASTTVAAQPGTASDTEAASQDASPSDESPAEEIVVTGFRRSLSKAI